VGKGWQCDEMPPEGMELYTNPPAAQVNEQMLSALEAAKGPLKNYLAGFEPGQYAERAEKMVNEAITSANSAKGE
jgi:hypothetical protein